MRSTLVVTTLIAILARAEVAGACSCAMPKINVSPEGTDAPLNTTVVVWVPSNVGKLADMTLSLRKARTGDPVPVDYKTMGAAALGVLEMTPRAKLDPNTDYEIAIVQGSGAPHPVGKFTTGKRVLSGAPVWKGIATASYYKAVPVCCMCMTGDPYAELTLKDPIDDDKSAGFRFAIWLPGADGKIDYAKPPTTYHEGFSGLWLGHVSTCSPANFVFPKQKALKIGIKLVDLAGHASTASEVVLDTTKPIKPPGP